MLRLLINLVLFLLVSSSAWSANWYVRDGGGSAAQCTGKTNAVYPGSGTNQNCAFARPMTALGYCTGNESGGSPCQVPPLISGGDTLFISGDSDTTPGTQAKYEIGYDDTGSGLTPGCNAAYTYACYMGNIPAGSDSSHPTIIIGTGTHQPQMWGTQRTYQVFTAYNSFITIQNFELTDHVACAYNDPTGGCNYNTIPYGQWAEDGLAMAGDGITLTNLYIHGFGRYGINTGQMGSATFNNVWTIGNGYGGITVGNGGTTSVTGTLTFNQPIVEWNGCVESYPVTGGIDNPSNYSNCFGQSSGGYGDGLAFGATGGQPAGNWTLIGPGSISFNTQDGLDILHGITGSSVDLIDKMRFEGNAGQQLKITGLTDSVTNNVIIGDCGWWYGATQSLSGGMQPGDSCRAAGTTIRFNVTNNSNSTFYNNTILTNGIAFETIDGGSTGCNGSTVINSANNIVLGGYSWLDDTTWNGAGGNSQTTTTYNDGNDGNGGGTCGGLVFNEDYNVISGSKNSNYQCTGAHDKCGTAPGFSSGTFPMGTSGGGRTTYYTGTSGVTLVSLGSSSAAVGAGQSGLTYWNTENDYYNVARATPPSIGGLELNSCAVGSYFCQYNVSCCNNSCVNNSCGTCTSTGGACSTGATCCTSLCSGSLCVSCIASGNSCSQNSDCCAGTCSGSICVTPIVSKVKNFNLSGKTSLIGKCYY